MALFRKRDCGCGLKRCGKRLGPRRARAAHGGRAPCRLRRYAGGAGGAAPARPRLRGLQIFSAVSPLNFSKLNLATTPKPRVRRIGCHCWDSTLTSKHLVFPQPAEAEVRPQPWLVSYGALPVPLPCGGYKKLGNLRGGALPPRRRGAPTRRGGHLGHVFMCQDSTPFNETSARPNFPACTVLGIVYRFRKR